MTRRELLALAAWRAGDIAGARRWFDIIVTDVLTPADIRDRVEMLIELAQAFACTGDCQQGVDVLDEALAASARREERWCMAELLRMKAEMLLGNVHVDYCNKCHGIFLDRGELETAVEAVRAKSRQTSPHEVVIAISTAGD